MKTAILIFFLASGARAESPRGVTIDAGIPSFKSPLEKKITLRLENASVQSFFEEISTQSKTEYAITGGLGKCRISVFLRDLTLRQVLQLTLETGGISYQQLGRSNVYTVTRGLHGGPECPPQSLKVATGTCTAATPPISLDCKDGSLSSLAGIVSDQSGANIIVWNEAVEFPISLSLGSADLGETVRRIKGEPALAVRQLRSENNFVLAVGNARRLAEPTEEPTTFTRNYKFPERRGREEPPANPSYGDTEKK